MNIFKIKVPFTYTEQVVPKRCRKPRPVRFNSSIMLSIHEFDAAEIPVAIRSHGSRWTDSGEKPFTTEYLWWRDRLYVKYCDSRYAHGPDLPMDKAEFIKRTCAKSGEVDENGYLMSWAWDSSGYKSKQEHRRELMCISRDHIFIDGWRYDVIGEPMYVIKTFGLGHNHGGWGTTLSTANSYNSNIHRKAYYRIDQFALALKAATETAIGRGDTNSMPIVEVQNPTRYDILIPEAVKRNPHKEHGTGCAFINQMEAIISSSPDVQVAGMGVVLTTAAHIYGNR